MMTIKLFIDPSMNEQANYNYEMCRVIRTMSTTKIHAIMAALDDMISEANKAEMAERLFKHFGEEDDNENTD